MKLSALLSNVSVSVAAATVLIAAAGAPAAHATGANFGGDRCSVYFQGEPTGGYLTASVAAGYSGSYHLVVQSATPGNAVLLNLSGRFSANRSYPTQVVATQLSTTYVNEAGSPINSRPDGPRRPLSTIQDGVYGNDARLIVEFEVRDNSGQLVCRQNDYQYENVPLPFGGRRRPQTSANTWY